MPTYEEAVSIGDAPGIIHFVMETSVRNVGPLFLLEKVKKYLSDAALVNEDEAPSSPGASARVRDLTRPSSPQQTAKSSNESLYIKRFGLE